MKQIGAAKFKQECLAILDRLSPEGIVITKRGRAVATLVPVGTDSAVLIGSLRGKLEITGDIRSIDVIEASHDLFELEEARAQRFGTQDRAAVPPGVRRRGARGGRRTRTA